MERRRSWILRGALGLALAGIGLVVARPFAVAWACTWRAADAERAPAEVVGKHEQVGLVLRVGEGSRAGTTCTAGTSPTLYAATAVGDVLDVVVLPDRTGECELVSTLESSAALLWAVTGLLGALVLGIVLLGLFLQRSLARSPPPPTTHLDAAEVRCPRCGTPMTEGYLPLVSGLHWRLPDQPLGLPHALAGLPGTVGWRGRPRLHGFRCAPCQVITLRYGARGSDPR